MSHQDKENLKVSIASSIKQVLEKENPADENGEISTKQMLRHDKELNRAYPEDESMSSGVKSNDNSGDKNGKRG